MGGDEGGTGGTRSVERRGVRIAFEDLGAGPPVVLLHSFLCDRGMWRAQADALRDDYRIVNVDLPGHGASGPAPPGVGLDDLVDDVLAVLDGLEIRSAVWGGLSIGGMIALRAALRDPERVRALLLLDTDAGSESLANRLRYRIMALAARALGLGPLTGPVSRIMFGATTRARRPELVARWREDVLSVDLDSALSILSALLAREAVIREVADIGVPGLVLVGSEDVALPPDRSEQLARSLRRATFRSIPRAGHLSALERPDAVTEAIRAFLAEVVSRPGPPG